MLRGVIERYGIPLAVYTDRHAVFQHWRHGSEEISASLGTGKPTQCGRALREMGIGLTTLARMWILERLGEKARSGT